MKAYLLDHKYRRESCHKLVNLLSNRFIDFYSTLEYDKINSVSISSGVDPTVRFIGSHISVMKPFFLDDKIPEKGLYIIQDCIRTQNLRILFEDNSSSKWGSFFTSMGCLVQPSKLDDLVKHLNSFLSTELNIDYENIKLRINKEYEDLIIAASKYFPDSTLEINTMWPKYFRH